jgi:hypothetical protein
MIALVFVIGAVWMFSAPSWIFLAGWALIFVGWSWAQVVVLAEISRVRHERMRD